MNSVDEKALRHYHDNWWKCDEVDIWYLAGRDLENPDYNPGWYFMNEADMLSGPYASRANAASALEEHKATLR